MSDMTVHLITSIDMWRCRIQCDIECAVTGVRAPSERLPATHHSLLVFGACTESLMDNK